MNITEILARAAHYERIEYKDAILLGEHIAQLERENGRLREALQFIADNAGTIAVTELGEIPCNAQFCGEQARAALAGEEGK